MAVDFTKVDGFDPSKGYKRVKFGEDGGITESELAELQKIQDQRLKDTMSLFLGRTTALLSGTIGYNGTTLTATNLVGYIDGESFKYSGSIALVNGDRVYLEQLESEITYQQDPNILDSRMNEETTRRIKNTYSLKKTNTGTGKYYELGQVTGGVFVETAGRITPYADLGTDDINVIASKPASTLLTDYPYGVTIFKYLTGDAGYPVTNSSIMTFNNAQGADGFQVLYGYVSSKPVQYVRYFTGSAWGAWEKFATTADLTAHANDAVAHITATERTTWNNAQLVKFTLDSGIAKPLPAHKDFNLVTELGIYETTTGSINGPSSFGTLFHLNRNSGGYVQTFYSNQTATVYTRAYFNGAWSPWKESATTDLATTLANGLMSASDKKALDGAQKTKLTPDTGGGHYYNTGSVDDILATGFHYVTSNVVGKPSGSYFLVVSGSTAGDYVKQTLYQYETDIIYTRTKRQGSTTFSDWKRQINNLELGTIVTAGDFVDSITTNLIGKVVGSNTANPNFIKRAPTNTLLEPTNGSWIEAVATGGTGYERVQSVDGISFTQGASVSGQIAQHLIGFNVIETVQRSYGNIPGVSLADKVAWVKANSSRLSFNWTGNGTNPTGNKANIAYWTGASWAYWTSNASAVPYKSSIITTSPANLISNDGYAYFLAYGEASDGTTASVINTDYVELVIDVKTNILNGLLDATPTVRGVMSASDKSKLDGVAMNANNYAHPSTHPASIIVQDSSNRFVSDAEKNTWNGKANNTLVTTGANGLMSSGDKSKLDGIASGAEVNQFSFSNILVNGVTVQADSKQDTFALLAGTNIALSGDAVNDTISISVTGTVANSASTPWTGITGKPTKVEDFGITDVTIRYASVIQGQNWSRVLQMKDASVFGHNFIMTVKGTRNAVVYKATLLVTTGHSQTCQITQLGNINYSDVQVRGVVDSNGNGYIEVRDTSNSIVAGTSQQVGVELIQIMDTNLVPITAYQSGVTLPSNHAERGLMTTVKNVSIVGDVAGNLTGDVTGNITGDVSGNAGTSTKWKTARTLSLTGDATGSTSFDGTGNTSITVTVQDDSHNHVIANVDGLQTALDSKETPSGAQTKADGAKNTAIAYARSFGLGDSPQNTLTSQDLNTVTDSGFYRLNGSHANIPPSSTYGQMLVMHGGGDTITQIVFPYAGGKMYFRSGNPSNVGGNGAWGAWVTVSSDAVVTTSANGLMIASDKSKLDGIATGANNYSHPSTHPATMITQDSNNRFVSDSEKNTWNSMLPRSGGTVTGSVRFTSTGASPFVVERTGSSANISMEYRHDGGSIFLGMGTDKKLRIAPDANVSAGDEVELAVNAQSKVNAGKSELYNYISSLGLGSSGESVSDCNAVLQTGFYYTSGNSVNTPSGESYGKLMVQTRNSTNPLQHVFQMFFGLSTGLVFTRKSTDNNANWTSWQALARDSLVTTSADGLMRSGDKSKLDGIASGANNYSHPSTHPASIIVQDSNNRFVTDADKNNWNAKETTSGAQSKADNALNLAKAYAVNTVAVGSGADPNLTLEGYILTNHANSPGQGLYWHINTNFYSSASTTSNRSQIAFAYNSSNPRTMVRNYYSSYGWSSWEELADNSLVTSALDGLMRKEDKSKLDGISSGANNYSHPSTHPASIIVQDSSNRFVTDAEKNNWNAKASTALASTFANGLMSKEQVVALESAQKYKLMDDTQGRYAYNDLNYANFEGFFYAGSGTTNSPVSYGGWVDVKTTPGGNFILQVFYGNSVNLRTYVRRSSNYGSTWEAWSEASTTRLDWTNASLQNGHSSLSSRTIKYARDGNFLIIRGGVAKDGVGSAGGESNKIFTLPSDLRPSTPFYGTPAQIGSGATSSYTNRFEVQTSGIVNMAFTWQVQYYGIDFIIPLD